MGEDDNGRSIRQEVMTKIVANLEQLWEVMVPTERYAVIHDILKKIVVYSDHLHFEFNGDGVVKLLQEAGLEVVHG